MSMRLTKISKIRRVFAGGLLLLLFAIASLPAAAADGPGKVLEAYLRAMYARDAATSYALISRIDKQEKSLEDYRNQTGKYEGNQLVLAKALASAIHMKNMVVEEDEGRAVITFSALLPNANDPALEPLVNGFDKVRLNEVAPDIIDVRRKQILAMADAGRLPVITSAKERWELVRDDDGWRVFLNWAEAIEVHFEAVVMAQLGWEFTPVKSRILAIPGETIEMSYRARNISEDENTGKARHIIGPQKQAGNMEIIACFCFLEQRLAPGEVVELPLVFRIDYDTPQNVRKFNVRYEFFPIGKFPQGVHG